MNQSSEPDGAAEGAPDRAQPPEEFAEIIYEKKDWIARVTINRPAAYNAYTDTTLREMTTAFRDAAGDKSVAVLVLTGSGDRAFCAGGDVEQHGDLIDDPEALADWIGALIETHTALRELGKPSIARINGMAAGGGNDLYLACDLAIAADHAKFVQIETKVGLAAVGGAFWSPLLAGERRARELFLIGEPISANKALLWGLVNDVVLYRQLDKAVDALCQKLIDRFPESMRLAREQLSFWKDLAWNAMIETARDRLTAQFSGKEARQGLRALAERREVDYRAFRLGSEGTRESGEENGAGAAHQTVNIRRRSCYACGADEIPASFDFCGMCGTRLA